MITACYCLITAGWGHIQLDDINIVNVLDIGAC